VSEAPNLVENFLRNDEEESVVGEEGNNEDVDEENAVGDKKLTDY
jgi:hypothetical protein